MDLDADSEWGIIAVVTQGSALVWQPREGVPVRLALPQLAGAVVWWEAGKVALSPQASAARVEIWGLADKARLATWGREAPLTPGIGATRLRAVELEVDFRRRRLYSLESFTGEMQVFETSGRLLWSRSVENPYRRDSEAWLSQIDRQAKAARDIQTPRLSALSFSLAEDGTAWIVQTLLEGQELRVARISPAGELSYAQIKEACTSHSLYVWGEWLIVQRGAAAPAGACKVVRKLP